MILRQFPGIQVRGNQVSRVDDTIVVEDTFRLYLNDELVTELVASADQLEELGAGFVVGEALVQDVDSVRVSEHDIRVYAEPKGESEWVLRSSGGMGTSRPPRKVSSSISIAPKDVLPMIRQIESEIWRRTGAVHCSVLFAENNLVSRSSDVGRHNTIDKVVGFAVLNDIDRSRCIIGCTGRQPGGMISKVANAGVPIIISKAAPTDKGILTANDAGVTLICFARGDRFTVYTHPHRISGILTQVHA
jgi:FdhD protein